MKLAKITRTFCLCEKAVTRSNKKRKKIIPCGAIEQRDPPTNRRVSRSRTYGLMLWLWSLPVGALHSVHHKAIRLVECAILGLRDAPNDCNHAAEAGEAGEFRG